MKNAAHKSSFVALAMASFLVVTVAPSGHGSTIFWGSRNNDSLYNSSGAALDETFSFELGSFVTGFTPTVANMDQWQSNWMVFDRAINGSGWDPSTQTIDLGSSVDHTATGGSTSVWALPSSNFDAGSEAYLWVFNSKTYASTSEWALLYSATATDDTFVTDPSAPFTPDAWQFSDPSDTASSYDWQTRDLDTAVFGGVKSTQGPGNYTVDPGTFTLQTHAIPEPSSALMILAVGVAFRLRRRPQASFAS